MKKPPTTLLRFGHKGQFVKYPKSWPYRMVRTRRARHDTKCDLLVGICACGAQHFGDEEWIQEMLDDFNMVIETHAEWVARHREN